MIYPDSLSAFSGKHIQYSKTNKQFSQTYIIAEYNSANTSRWLCVKNNITLTELKFELNCARVCVLFIINKVYN